MDLTQSLVPSVAQANIKGVGLVSYIGRDKIWVRSNQKGKFLLDFKSIILQYKGQKNQWFLYFFFSKK